MRRDRILAGALLALAMLAGAMPGAPAYGIAHADAVADSSVRTAGAPLVVASRTVFVFRDSFGTIPPLERRERATRVLADIVGSMRRDSVHSTPTPHGDQLYYGDAPLFTVTPGDVDTLAGETLAGVTARTRAGIETAMREAMEARSPRYLAIATLLALLATGLLVAALRLLMTLDGRLLRWLIETSRRRLGRMAARGVEVPSQDRVIHSIATMVHALGWLASLGLVYMWLVFVLRRFPWTAPLGDTLRQVLWSSVSGVLLGVVRALPGLLTVVVIAILTRFMARLLGAVFVAIERGTLRVPWIHPDTAVPTRRIAVTVLWLFAFMAAYPFIPGSETAVFKGASVLLGALLSFGSSGIVSQAMNGFVLMYSRSFKRGEFIHVGDVMGTVSEVGLLSTKITTPRNEEVTIPNSVMVGSVTTNDSRLAAEHGLILNTVLTIGYDAPWRQVHALMIEAARRTPGLLMTPEPRVLQRALSDFYVEYVLAVRIEDPTRRVPVLAKLHENLQDQFNEHGVQIMSPHYENERASGPPMVPKSKWWAPPAKPPEGAPPA